MTFARNFHRPTGVGEGQQLELSVALQGSAKLCSLSLNQQVLESQSSDGLIFDVSNEIEIFNELCLTLSIPTASANASPVYQPPEFHQLGEVVLLIH